MNIQGYSSTHSWCHKKKKNLKKTLYGFVKNVDNFHIIKMSLGMSQFLEEINSRQILKKMWGSI